MCIAKERFKKKYRIETLDIRLRKAQTRAEFRAIDKLYTKGIPVPHILYVDRNKYTIYMENIEGITLKKYINSIGNLLEISNETIILKLGTSIGNLIATVHNNHIIHGDLTTSNMIYNNKSSQEDPIIYLIDFGLSSTSELIEDKAVDLYVLERAIQTTHQHAENLLKYIFDAYQEKHVASQAVMQRLQVVRSRGRKRSMVG